MSKDSHSHGSSDETAWHEPSQAGPVVIAPQKSKTDYSFEPELSYSSPRQAQWRKNSLGLLPRYFLLILSYLITIGWASQSLPYFGLACMSNKGFSDVTAAVRQCQIAKDSKDTSYLSLRYKLNGVEHFPKIDCSSEAASLVGKDIIVQVHPYYPDMPIAKGVGQLRPSMEGIRLAFLPVSLLLAGLVMWYPLISAPLSDRKLIRDGIACCGEITKREAQGCRLHYKFSLPGKTHQYYGSQAIGETEWENTDTGDRLTVICDKRNPSVNLLYRYCDWRAY